MLKITGELINYLKQDETPFEIVRSYINGLMKVGSKKDADILFDCYISNPLDFDFRLLFPLFKKFGDTFYSEKLFNIYITHPKIVAESTPEILHLLGHFKNESIKEILKNYIVDDDSDHYLCKNAVFGLLHFDCQGYEKVIESEIIKCYNKNIFSEYVPALVCKLKNKEKILEELFVLGNEYASTDCNGGIILGFSLCGEMGKKYFMDALNTPHWEVDGCGTGTILATYQGIKNLKISFGELYSDIQKETNNDTLEHLLAVLFALLEVRIQDYDDNFESFTELYIILFESENPDDTLIDVARKVDKDEEAYVLKDMLKLKVTEELILKTC